MACDRQHSNNLQETKTTNLKKKNASTEKNETEKHNWW